MPEIQLQNQGLIIEIPGTVSIIGKDYSRKLTVVDMQYNIENKNVVVSGVMKFFDQQGKEANTHVAKSYAVSLTADNSDFCDVQTGIKLCAVKDEFTDAEKTQLNTLLQGKNYAKQFDWFYNIGATQPIIVNDMIKSFLLDAIQRGSLD